MHRTRQNHRLRVSRRRGTILVITGIVLIALIGLLGLVIDAGQLMTAHRVTQNAADAGAMAAAMDLVVGNSSSTARTSTSTFVQGYNGLSNATVIVNIPPASGPYAGNSNFVEVVVSNPVNVRFIQLVGVAAVQTVTARAVAGWEGVAVGEGVMAVDPGARPGINLSGNGNLTVQGTVVSNSNGGGKTATGEPINNGESGYAISTNGNGSLYASDVQSVGGVRDPSAIQNITPGNPTPLHTGVVAQPDPFQFMPTPTIANGAVANNYGAVKLSGNQNVTLSPGVYTSVTLSSNVNVTLNPGIYVIAGGGLSISGNATLTGNNVMIYNTGSDFNVSTGLPDSGDGSSSPPASGNATFGGVSLTGNAVLNLTPYANASSPFNGMALYQRRLNTQPLSLAGNGSADILKGTVYAKWAPLDLSGNGTFNSQFIVQKLDFTGNGNLTLDTTGQPTAQTNQVFLVE